MTEQEQMKAELFNTIIKKLEQRPFGGMFRNYINEGFQINPKGLLKELYEQVSGASEETSDMLLGRDIKILLKLYFKTPQTKT